MERRSACVSNADQSVSLAVFAARLGQGSTCFCCGGEMRSPKSPGERVVSVGSEVVAVCTACGCEVGVPEEEAEANTSGFSRCSRLVAAA